MEQNNQKNNHSVHSKDNPVAQQEGRSTNSSIAARKKKSRAKAKKRRRQRRILAFAMLFTLVFFFSLTVYAVNSYRHVEITLDAVSTQILQGEEVPELQVKAECTKARKEKRYLNRKEKYRVSNLVEDLNAGKGYTIDCEVNNKKEGSYKMEINLTKELQKRLSEEWDDRVTITITNGTFTVRNKTGDWDGEKFKRWDGTYVKSDFVDYKGDIYYFNKEGKKVTGVQQIGYAECTFDEDGKMISKETSIDPNKPMMALTFDDGPGGNTAELLEVLNKYNAHATFFMLGQKVEGNEDVIKKMVDIGCELGNHSYNHAQLSELDAEGIKEQISKTSTLISDAGGKSVTVLRPPYGDYSGDVASNAGLPIILWNIDTLDWESRNTEQIIQNVKTYADDGDIVLMHDIYDTTIDAAIELIPYLVGEGYQLVTVSELAEARGLELQNGVAITDFNL